MANTVALLKLKTQAALNNRTLSIAKMTSTTDDEAAALTARFNALAGKVTKAVFARRYNLPGGASMLSQHLSGNRPMSLEAAMAYARGFGVPLSEISKRIADQVQAATGLLEGAPASSSGPPSLPQSLEVLGIALAAAPISSRPALAMNLAEWAKEGGQGPWPDAVLTLLQAAPSKHARTA